jgi:hypothetical protein
VLGVAACSPVHCFVVAGRGAWRHALVSARLEGGGRLLGASRSVPGAELQLWGLGMGRCGRYRTDLVHPMAEGCGAVHGGLDGGAQTSSSPRWPQWQGE